MVETAMEKLLFNHPLRHGLEKRILKVARKVYSNKKRVGTPITAQDLRKLDSALFTRVTRLGGMEDIVHSFLRVKYAGYPPSPHAVLRTHENFERVFWKQFSSRRGPRFGANLGDSIQRAAVEYYGGLPKFYERIRTDPTIPSWKLELIVKTVARAFDDNLNFVAVSKTPSGKNAILFVSEFGVSFPTPRNIKNRLTRLQKIIPESLSLSLTQSRGRWNPKRHVRCVLSANPEVTDLKRNALHTSAPEELWVSLKKLGFEPPQPD
ncbi:MAG: hypothetical protein V1817_03905 [Candidatus Micrarchaeota archaeon]